MALARVVSFEDVTSERMAQLASEIEGSEQPEGMNASELLLLHDPESDRSLALVFFETEDDYRKGDEILGSMPTGDTPGRRTSVTKYTVAARMTP
jgi:hypothetical protein